MADIRRIQAIYNDAVTVCFVAGIVKTLNCFIEALVVAQFLPLTVFWQGFWTWGSGYPPRCPYSTVRKSMPGVRSAGRVGGQATQPGSTRTPSPSVQPGGITPPGSGATMASRHRHKGQTVKLRGNPEGQRYRPGVATSYGHHVVAWG